MARPLTICAALGALGALLLLPVLRADAAPAAPAAGRETVPDRAARDAAAKALEEVYGDDLAKAKSATARSALAKKMLDAAAAAGDDPASRYVLLERARDLAADAGDDETTQRAVELLTESFRVDGRALKADALERLTRAAMPSDRRVRLVESVGALIDEAVRAGEFDTARRLVKVGTQAAQKARGTDAARKMAARGKQVRAAEAALAAYEKAAAMLEDEPDDPQANLAAGRFLCLVRGDWTSGLPRLAAGADAALKAQAERDLAGARDAAGWVRIGDGWWDLAQKERDGQAGARLMARAGVWYAKAAPQLKGLAKAKADKRLAEARAAGGGADKNVRAAYLDWCKITNRNSGLPLGIGRGNKEPGEPAVQWPWAGTPEYFWRLEPAGDESDTYYKLVNKHSGQCLTVRDASREQGAPIEQHPWNGSDAQQWSVEVLPGGALKFTNRHSGMAMAIGGGDKKPGAVAVQWPWHDWPDQHWLMEPLPPSK